MTKLPNLKTLSDADLESLDIHQPQPVNLRRDLYRFVCYVQDKGILRTRRENNISKTSARQLAKLLSWEDELECVENDGCGNWSERVSEIALHMGIVSYDTEGEYVGYTSSAPSYVDNYIEVNNKRWEEYLRMNAIRKERALLDALLEKTANEFFYSSTLLDNEYRFDTFGSARGPAGKIDLPRVRAGLFDLLSSLKPDSWYDTRDVAARLKQLQPHLILDPSNREPNYESNIKIRDWERKNRGYGYKSKSKKNETKKPKIELEDIYNNFRERDPETSRFSTTGFREIKSSQKDGFMRVEGRYLAYFLSEIPYIMGFVGLAQRRAKDPHGLDVSPSFDRLRGFCLTQRFFDIINRNPVINQVKTTVLPTFEVIVESPSFPESTLRRLSSLTVPIKEEGPLHTLKLERRKIVSRAAAEPSAPPVAVLLDELVSVPLPQNVRTEVELWSGKGEQVVFYENAGLLEITDKVKGEKNEILTDLGPLILKSDMGRFAVLRNPEAALEILTRQCRVPSLVQHRKSTFASSGGRLDGPSTKKRRCSADSKKETTKKNVSAEIITEDLVGYRIDNRSLLSAFKDALQNESDFRVHVVDGALIFPAAALPIVRKVVKKLSKKFNITVK
jgi:hypothetical protein